MRFLADECCDAGLVQALREDGHDVLFAAEAMRGAIDNKVLERAYTEDRVVITEDKDFGELVYRLGLPTHAIILLRLASDQHELKIARIRQLLMRHPQQVTGRFVVIEVDKFRLRPLR